jgi:ATP-dependent RNA helicase DeaD
LKLLKDLMNSFTETQLSEEIVKAITELGYETPTEIQKLTIPFILSDERDLIALAQTGTGKTAAFSLPTLDMIDASSKKIQFLVLCPTRELCLQISRDIKNYTKYMPGVKSTAVYGGSSISEQIRELKQKPQVIVGTPGRVIDLINRKVLDFTEIQWLVLDEADEMLSMGFKDDLEIILRDTPKEKQTFLFSATMNREIERMSKNYLNNPHKISSGGENQSKKNISHEYYVVSYKNKKPALRRLIDANPNQYSIVFCRTRMETQEVADFLMQSGYPADALHGDLSQAQRDTVMKKFRLKNISILVATDVAARGIDVDSITHVVHYSLPDDPEVFTHRSGRTARAGKNGISISLVKPDEGRKFKQIQKDNNITDIKEKQIPTAESIIQAQVNGFFEKLLAENENAVEIDPSLLPDLSELTKEDLVKKILQFKLQEITSFYDGQHDLRGGEIDNNSKGSRRERDRDRSGSRDRNDRGRDRDRRDDRGGRENRFAKSDFGDRPSRPERFDRERKPAKNNDSENMTRFFFNLGKRDSVRKTDVFDLVNDATAALKKKVDIGDINIMDKFSFFEVDKRYQNDVLEHVNTNTFRGKEMRLEVAE